jgi:Zn-dependent oligopeptidase
MLNKETRERIADYFDAADLIDFLQIETEDVVDAFEPEIEEALEEIEELIQYRRENDGK